MLEANEIKQKTETETTSSHQLQTYCMCLLTYQTIVDMSPIRFCLVFPNSHWDTHRHTDSHYSSQINRCQQLIIRPEIPWATGSPFDVSDREAGAGPSALMILNDYSTLPYFFPCCSIPSVFFNNSGLKMKRMSPDCSRHEQQFKCQQRQPSPFLLFVIS